MSRNLRTSGFIKSLGGYDRPEPGEELSTERGKAVVLRIVPYDSVVEDMSRNGISRKEIGLFDARVEHFLGNKRKYFEAELAYPDGEVERIDWSEYLAIKNRRKRG
jgi:hypothetical protein